MTFYMLRFGNLKLTSCGSNFRNLIFEIYEVGIRVLNFDILRSEMPIIGGCDLTFQDFEMHISALTFEILELRLDI